MAPNNSSDISISFIIPVLNGEKTIQDCIDHIIREKDSVDEIIVVDNGSIDRTKSIVELNRGVTFLEHPDITVAALRNRGAERAKGSVLAFIDSDCLVCPGWRKAVDEVLSDSSIGATGSICSIPDDATWIERTWWSFRYDEPIEVNYINSGNLVIPIERFRQINGFREDLVTDEDSDICSRLLEKGSQLHDHPGIRAIHLGNARTLAEFYRKERWHSTSIIGTNSWVRPDKAMIMTILFALTSLVALSAFLLSLLQGQVTILPFLYVFIAPVLTAAFRVIQYQSYSYFFYFVPLYFVFYLVRSITVIESFFKRI